MPAPTFRPWMNLLILFGVLITSLVFFLWFGFPQKTDVTIKKGVTFSQIYAESLGLNWRELLTVMLDDLGVRQFRIPAFWNVVQPHADQFDFERVDYQMDEIARRQGKVLLVVGLKQPRWPECWRPDWVRTLSTNDEHAARLAYIEQTVLRYKDHPALESWQVENEANFPFGDCPPSDLKFFKQELELVQRLDPSHPITSTDSGELSTWLAIGPKVDRLGISIYRVVRLPWGTIWPYDWIPPYWYARRAVLTAPWVKHIFVSEFQMEPWVEKSITETPIETQFETFDIDRMQKNFWFAERMQFDEIYFWGVEWWWWMKTKQNDPRFWGMAKEFFLVK